LQHEPVVLTNSRRLRFFESGYLALQNYVTVPWLSRLQAAMNALVEQSRIISASNDVFLLDDGHSAEHPRLHRITSPQDVDQTFWEFFKDRLIVDLVADVVGPDVKFHHCKLNIKSEKANKGFGWHQDILGWPHTDFGPAYCPESESTEVRQRGGKS
jgi:ectoine hydroxylase